MTKETQTTQASTPEKVVPKTIKPKRKLTKRAVKVDTPKPKKVSVPKEPKVVKPISNRKVNTKPVLAKTTGINISPAKVKNVVSNLVLNKDTCAALKELKEAIPRKITKTVNGTEVVEDFKGVPVAQMSKKTLDFIAHATECFEKASRYDYAKNKISKMPEQQRHAYHTAKNLEKDVFDNVEKDKFLCDVEPFDSETFNIKYDAEFYSAYDNEKKLRDASNKTDEWKFAIDRVTKLKNRFSTNSRVFLSAFVECLIKQIAHNGTVCCVADNKKIIQLSHILDTSKPGFKERFSLYPLIVNLDTFKQAQKYLQTHADSKSVEKADVDVDTDGEVDTETETKSVKTDKNLDVFNIEGVSVDKQYQFRYYIGESCREVRMDLASAGGDNSDVYNYTSVSKIFKNFCSTLICEFLMRIGIMLGKEIETRGIRTVNDTIIGTVISHYHTVCGVDETFTFDFIRSSVSKYYSYVTSRQETRKQAKQTKLSDPTPPTPAV